MYGLSPDHRQHHYPSINDTLSNLPSYYKHREEVRRAVQPTTFEMQTEREYSDSDNLG